MSRSNIKDLQLKLLSEAMRCHPNLSATDLESVVELALLFQAEIDKVPEVDRDTFRKGLIAVLSDNAPDRPERVMHFLCGGLNGGAA